MKGPAIAALVAVGAFAAAVVVIASCTPQSDHPGELGNCTPKDGATCSPVTGGGSGGNPATDAGADADGATDATADGAGDDGSSDAASE